jgi:hypothetical protein
MKVIRETITWDVTLIGGLKAEIPGEGVKG